MSDDLRPISTVPAPLAPFYMFGRDLAEIFSDTISVVAGAVGMVVVSGAIVAFFTVGINLELALAADEGEELEIDFMPGELARIGPKPEDLPEKIIVQETRVPPDAEPVTEAVTKEEEPPKEQEEKPEEKPDKKVDAKDKYDPNKKKDAEISDKNRESNTPYKNDLPTVDELPGDPFGSPDGWSDRMKDGDPWATAVMAALNKMQYPSYGAGAKSGALTFKLRICKDGTIEQVTRKASTGDSKLDDLMVAEIERVKIPKPPADVLKMMKANCVSLKYEFKWNASGKVK